MNARLAGLIAAATLLVILGCGAGTFLITRDGSSTYFGQPDTLLSRRLCSSGDLKNILSAADLPERIRDDFYRYNCTDDRSRDTVISLFAFLSPDEKIRLKRAFKRFGYEINIMHC